MGVLLLEASLLRSRLCFGRAIAALLIAVGMAVGGPVQAISVTVERASEPRPLPGIPLVKSQKRDVPPPFARLRLTGMIEERAMPTGCGSNSRSWCRRARRSPGPAPRYHRAEQHGWQPHRGFRDRRPVAALQDDRRRAQGRSVPVVLRASPCWAAPSIARRRGTPAPAMSRSARRSRSTASSSTARACAASRTMTRWPAACRVSPMRAAVRRCCCAMPATWACSRRLSRT